ncbi:MAG: hypothetical protein KGV51_03405 [Moraxellaceae bacterium]|nr:hypothetical protein [Moraxellaceae bacterium]
MEINENLNRLTRNRLRLAIVKASTDNKTKTPTQKQIFNALVALYAPDDKIWAVLVEDILVMLD